MKTPFEPTVTHKPKQPYFTGICMMLSLALLSLMGCGPAATPPVGSTVSPEKSTSGQPANDASLSPADALLDKVIQKYQQAAGYTDQGSVTLSYMLNGREEKSIAGLEVAFERPNKFRLNAYQVTAAADGEFFRARIEDPQTNNIDNQFVERKLEDRLSLADIQSDAVIHSVLANSMVGYPLQLDLLLSDQPLLPFRESKSKSILPEQQLDGRACHRLQIDFNGSPVVFWIDKEELLIWRVEFPTEGLIPSADATDVKLVAEFRKAKFIPAGKFVGSSKFRLVARADAKRVNYFVELPAALPSKLLGQKLAPFQLTQLDGNPWSGPTDGVRVLAWFRDHPACEHTLKQLEMIHAKSANLASFETVCSDPIAITANDSLRQQLAQWQVTLPSFRDEKEVGNHLLHIDELPTLVVLDAENTVHFVGKGYNPQLTEQLPVILQRLNRGEDVAAEVLNYVKTDQARYQREIEAGGPPLIVRPKLAKKTAPEQLLMRQVWQRTDIDSPGNLVSATHHDGSQSIFLLSGTNQILELDLQGKTLRETTAEEGLAFNFLRYASTPTQTRLVASAVFGKALAVFDAELKKVGQFPVEVNPRVAIGDAAIGDLDGDNALDIAVGLTSAGGVIRLDADANPAWETPHKIDSVSLRLSPLTSNGRQIVSTTMQGQLSVIAADGQAAQTRALRNREVFGIATAPTAGSATSYCGITYDKERNFVLLGMNDQLQQVWEHPLAKGTHVVPVQFLTCGDLIGNGHHQWIAAGPDGSIDVISDNADFFESFGYGDYITGIEVINTGKRRLLIVATAKSLAAYTISRLSTN